MGVFDAVTGALERAEDRNTMTLAFSERGDFSTMLFVIEAQVTGELVPVDRYLGGDVSDLAVAVIQQRVGVAAETLFVKTG